MLLTLPSRVFHSTRSATAANKLEHTVTATKTPSRAPSYHRVTSVRTTFAMPQKSGLVASAETQQTPQYAALAGLTTGAADASPLPRFCDPVEKKLESNNASDAEEQLYNGWVAVIARAAATSHTEGGRSALAAFLVSLTQKRADGQQANSDYGVVKDMKVWQDLPMFGWQVRDAWNFGMTSFQWTECLGRYSC